MKQQKIGLVPEDRDSASICDLAVENIWLHCGSSEKKMDFSFIVNKQQMNEHYRLQGSLQESPGNYRSNCQKLPIEMQRFLGWRKWWLDLFLFVSQASS